MRIPLPEIEPVAIALDQLEASDRVRFSGIDLDNGARVTVTIDRDADQSAADPGLQRTAGLVLL